VPAFLRFPGAAEERRGGAPHHHGNDNAIAHNLANGAEVWRVADLNPKGGYNATLRFVASPVAARDLIVVPVCRMI
jgi:hypothetical protein